MTPDLQEAVIEGRQAKGMQLDQLTGPVPSEWEDQPVCLLHRDPNESVRNGDGITW